VAPEIASVITSLSETVTALRDENTATAAALHLAEVKGTVNGLKDPTGKVALSAAQANELEKILLVEPNADKRAVITKFAEGLLSAGLVQLGEFGDNGNNGGGRNNPQGQTAFTEAVEKVVKEAGGEDKLSYSDAFEKVARERPELYAESRRESYMKEA
jgi:hypothetical protein